MCGSAKSTEFKAYRDFRVVDCEDCTFRFTDLDTWTYPYSDRDYYAGKNLATITPDQPHIRRRVQMVRKHCPGGRVLDIGCGFGELPVLLANEGYQAVGVDESPSVIEALRTRFPRVEWHAGSVADLLDELGTFNAVTLFHVLEHIPAPRAAMQSFKRLVRPGGILVLEVPNTGGLSAQLKGADWRYYLNHHVNYFDAASLVRLAAATGYEVVEIKGYYGLTYPGAVAWKRILKSAMAAAGFRDVISITLRAPK